MAELIWLASYPKSGNTWLRAILTALANADGETPDVNRLVGSMLVGWPVVEAALGVTPTELTEAELQDLRPLYIEDWARELDTDHTFLKTHDALGTTRHQLPTAPVDITRAAVYLVRNPLDVCVSYAHHSGVTPHQMTMRLNDTDAQMARPPHRIGNQVPQPTGSWSGHVDSWTIDPPFPVHVLRYEDLIAAPVETVRDAVRALGLDHSEHDVERAVSATTFDRLADREQSDGFREKSLAAESFFRRGEVGSWRTELAEEDVASIVETHRGVMTRLGYLDVDGALLV